MAKKRVKNIIGKKFNKLTIIEDLGYTKVDGTRATNRYVKCLCECGNTIVVSYNNVVVGNTKSCGCLGNGRGKGKGNKNEYYYSIVDGQTVAHVKMSNCDDICLVDKSDWSNLKNYCWHKTKSGYVASNVDGKFMTMQRALIPDVQDGYERHHVNHNRLDNRRQNLQVVTKLENLIDREFKNKTSKQTGVCWYTIKGKWLAYIHKDGEKYILGLFDDEEDAIAVRIQAEIDFGFRDAA